MSEQPGACQLSDSFSRSSFLACGPRELGLDLGEERLAQPLVPAQVVHTGAAWSIRADQGYGATKTWICLQLFPCLCD